jgi:hypothetical protein
MKALKPPKPLSKEEEEEDRRECTFQPKTNWAEGPHCWVDRRFDPTRTMPRSSRQPPLETTAITTISKSHRVAWAVC